MQMQLFVPVTSHTFAAVEKAAGLLTQVMAQSRCRSTYAVLLVRHWCIGRGLVQRLLLPLLLLRAPHAFHDRQQLHRARHLGPLRNPRSFARTCAFAAFRGFAAAILGRGLRGMSARWVWYVPLCKAERASALCANSAPIGVYSAHHVHITWQHTRRNIKYG